MGSTTNSENPKSFEEMEAAEVKSVKSETTTEQSATQVEKQDEK